MIKYATMGTCVLILTIMGGCAGNMPGPGGVFPGGLINATVVPGDLANVDQRYTAYPDSFEVVGMVEGYSSNVNILGIFAFGNGGYIPAFEDALTSYDIDGIINCNADIKSTGILGIFSSSKTMIKGIGVKIKD